MTWWRKYFTTRWQRLQHEWSEPFTIGGEESHAGPIVFVVRRRTLRVCLRCGATSAMGGLCLRNWIKP